MKQDTNMHTIARENDDSVGRSMTNDDDKTPSPLK